MESPNRASVRVRLRRLRDADADLPVPRYMSASAAGLDLCAAIPGELTLGPGRRSLVPTGYALEIPPGFEGQVRPRSGLAVRHGVTLVNSPGTIDADYRGEVQVVMINLGDEPFVLKRGERIAQLVIAPVATASLEVVTELSATARGENGFGSSGR